MINVINAIYEILGNDGRLAKCHLQRLGPVWQHPAKVPYINIIPKSQPRERVRVGGTPYDVEPTISLVCWEVSMESMEDAYKKLESLLTTVLDILDDGNYRTLQDTVDSYDAGINEYGQEQGAEAQNYYVAEIEVKTFTEGG